MSTITAPLPDLRRPGQPMAFISLKLPADCIETLQEHADRIGASRGAVVRHLVVRALQELEPTATA